MKKQRFKQLTETRLKNRICSPFMGALVILGLSTLPYLHDIITTSEGLKSWVPVLGIEKLLTSESGVLGFSTYRVFIYTLLISIFSAIGFTGWYLVAKNKYYRYALIGVVTSIFYHLFLIIFKLRRTVLNEPETKLIGLFFVFIVLGFLSYKKYSITMPKVLAWCAFYFISILPFLHDVFKVGTIMDLIPNLGFEEMLTNREGKVRGLSSYRLLLYLLGTYLFSHLGWMGWFMQAEGKRYRPFLLLPVVLSLYHVIVIAMSWRETEFNSPSIKLYITLGISVIVAYKFYFKNKHYPEFYKAPKNTTTIKSNENEN